MWAVMGGILFASHPEDFPFQLLVPFGAFALILVPIGFAFRWHQKRRDSITRRLVVHGGAVVLFEDCDGRVKESRLPVEKVRRVRQMRFEHSHCWGVEILGSRQMSLRVETPWSQEKVAEFTREVKAALWAADDPRAALP
ncbi:hypothetical protein llg_09030 [Luteolibacter sp. LG18]|nr:hypothetical protein llg_09030 [Luteolibacter sp. LG18]